jgi:TonB family protein
VIVELFLIVAMGQDASAGGAPGGKAELIQSPLSLACESTPRGWAALDHVARIAPAGDRAAMAGRSPEAELAAAVAANPQSPDRRLDLARCYDAKWQLANADRELSAAITRLQTLSAEAAPPVAMPGAPLRVGGAIARPAKIQNVPPQYPDLAREAGVSGIVIVEAVIDPQGNVTDVTVTGSIPALDAAAVRAVRGWKYAPTLVDRHPVAVTLPLFVGFGVQADIASGDLIDIARFYAGRRQYDDALGAAAQALAVIRRDAAAIARTSQPGVQVAAPVKVRDVKPALPAGARTSQTFGTVNVEALIDQQGIVRRARIARPTGQGLDQAALEAVSQWRYRPAVVDGEPVGVRMTVAVNFTPEKGR